MTLRHMKIFLTLCECGCNTTRAADVLLMTQPAVSLAIRELEKYYGTTLFDRMGKRLRINAAGEKFREYAARISTIFDDMEYGLRNWDAVGIMRVGASITIGSQLLPGYVKKFREIHPGIEIRAAVEPSDVLERKVLSGELDFALIEGVAHSPVLISEEYLEDRLAVICPKEGPFASGQHVSIEEFCRQKLLLREKGSGTREVFDRAAEAAGFAVEPIWEAMSTTALVNAVISGLGITVVPYRMVSGPVAKGMVSEIWVEKMDLTRKFRIIYHRDKLLTASAKEFMEMCRTYRDENVYSGIF